MTSENKKKFKSTKGKQDYIPILADIFSWLKYKLNFDEFLFVMVNRTNTEEKLFFTV